MAGTIFTHLMLRGNFRSLLNPLISVILRLSSSMSWTIISRLVRSAAFSGQELGHCTSSQRDGDPWSHIFSRRSAGGSSVQRSFLWAHLGIRNSFQRGLRAKETAARNLTYSREGINYPPKREIVRAFSRYFDHVEFIERELVAATREVSRLSGLLDPVISWPGVEALYRDFHTRVLLARK
jgi:hypothetical protein